MAYVEDWGEFIAAFLFMFGFSWLVRRLNRYLQREGYLRPCGLEPTVELHLTDGPTPEGGPPAARSDPPLFVAAVPEAAPAGLGRDDQSVRVASVALVVDASRADAALGGVVVEIALPTGALGIKIDLRGAANVITSVASGSPCERLLGPGDQIARLGGALGDVDCAGMMPSAITGALVALKDTPGRLVYVIKASPPTSPCAATSPASRSSGSRVRFAGPGASEPEG